MLVRVNKPCCILKIMQCDIMHIYHLHTLSKDILKVGKLRSSDLQACLRKNVLTLNCLL